jgi:hypothetical protein
MWIEMPPRGGGIGPMTRRGVAAAALPCSGLSLIADP